MKNLNQIEDIFQKLENGVSGDLSGKESVWEKVQQKLDKTQEKKKVIPFPVWKLSGIAASILLLIGVGYFIWDKQNNPTIMYHNLPPIVNIENSDSESHSSDEIQNLEEEITDSSESNENRIVKKENPVKPVENKSVEPEDLISEPKQEIVAINEIVSGPNREMMVITDTIPETAQPEILPEINLAQTKTESKQEPEKKTLKVSGYLEDPDGFPIADALIEVRGNTSTSVADENGNFNIDANVGDVLVVTDLTGVQEDYKVTKENLGKLKFGQNIELQAVTLVGGVKINPSQKVGAYTTVRQENFEGKPVTSVDQVLNGKVAGLSFSTNNGQPGTTSRGCSSMALQPAFPSVRHRSIAGFPRRRIRAQSPRRP